MMISCETIQRFLTVTDQQRNPYWLEPFSVPENVTSITVEYAFTPGTGESPTSKNTLDLGLIDPRGDEQGFRGWSGSMRQRITISLDRATPGYLAGPLYPGVWHVLLGLYRIAPEGCEVTLTVTCEQQEISTEGRWYRGDLHCHTHHSDGTGSMADLATTARLQGLDFLAVTEHNTLSHLPDLARHSGADLLLIPGMEMTTYRGHANVWGIREWLDFRAITDEQMRWLREQVRQMGLLFSINHPKYGGPPWEFADDMDADAIEGWQVWWGASNYESLAWWDGLLCQNRRIVLVGGSDRHQKPLPEGATSADLTSYEVGTPTTWVYAPELSEPAILAHIRAGHVFVSQSPHGPQLELTAQAGEQTAMMGDVLRVAPDDHISFRCRVRGGCGCSEKGGALRIVHQGGEAQRVPVQGDDFVYCWDVVAQSDDYVRIEVIEPTNVPLDKDPIALWAFALSNPIYVRVGE